MTLWIDADACPRPVRDIMLRAAKRRQLQLVLVANSSLGLPPAPGVRQVVVPGGAAVADLYVIELAEPNDLVVTADVPLADGLVRRNITAINPRGEVYDSGSIGERLAVRNLMDELRGAGLAGRGGPAPYSDKDKQAFANALDRLLAQGLGKERAWGVAHPRYASLYTVPAPSPLACPAISGRECLLIQFTETGQGVVTGRSDRATCQQRAQYRLDKAAVLIATGAVAVGPYIGPLASGI